MYRYTLDCTKLSEEQRDFYEENGFLVIRKLVSHEDIKSYHDRFLDICHRRVKKNPSLIVMKDVTLLKQKNVDPERVVNKIQDYIHDPIFSQYLKLPQILKYVECFTGKDIDAVHTMLINKPPDSGLKSSRHPLHQDLYYFPFRPTNRIVCSWTAMEKVTRENGCLVVMPGTHKGQLLRHGYPQWDGNVNKMYHGILDLDFDQRKIYLEMEEGDTVFFHPLLIHGSGSNRTSGFRKAISCHYSTSHKEYIDIEGTIQEDIAEEVLAVAKKKFPNVELTFEDIWKLRSLTVQTCGITSKL